MGKIAAAWPDGDMVDRNSNACLGHAIYDLELIRIQAARTLMGDEDAN